MAEKRKRRRQSTSLSEQPNSEQISSQMSEAESSGPSCVSMKDDRSMGEPLVFGVNKTPSSQMSEDEWMKDDASMDEPIMFSVNKTPSQLTEEPHRKKLRKDPEYQRDTEEDAGRSHFLKAKKNLQNAMEKKFTLTFEGNGDQENSMNSIYTTLDITTAETEGKHEEQSFRHTKQPQAYEHSVNLRDIFKPLPGQKTPIRTVLTKGVAGIGKSFSVQKFILDWAEGRENQDVDFVFNVAFRELNLSKDDKSLHQLLTELHPAVHDLKDAEDLVKAKVIVILDGLDESRLQLDFKNKRVTSVSEVTSVGNLLANLIQGNLLHDAKLWITSRPAAANQIPAEFVDMVTEIRGFSDPQKEEYFRRRFLQDVGLADRIISHIRSSQSLDIMCQILIFCWIAAVLFKEIFGGDEKAETPQTLTEMMAYFLFTQTKRRSRKYDQKTNKERLLKTHKEFPLKLGKLAFLQLQKNNLIFYDEDLEECGIDVQEAAVYSGFCTSVLREEQVFSQKKVLSPDSGINLFQNMVEMRDHKVKDEILEFLKSSDRSKTELTPLHCSALAYMLQVSKNDLDVLDLKRFNTSEEGRRRLIPAVRSSRKAKLADCKVNEEWIKHLAFGLKFPDLPLRDLDLSNNDLKDSGVELLCDGLSSQCCRLKTLRLSGCQITEVGCGSLASTLRSKASQLVKLDLSYNHPGESGKKLLSELRDDTEYKLSKLNLDHDGSHRMQPGFKKYACELTLDPNTAHKNLLLSEGNRKVTWVEDQQPYPHRLERFDHCQQVLCDQGLEERCYWEVEVTEPFNIGLTYRTIDRKGDGNDRKLGRNDKSWCMSCSKDGCFVWHNNKSVDVFPQSSRSSKLGVYLDWPAGTLSFYRVSSDSPILIHTFHEKFKEPLYPAVELQPDSSALFC